MTEPNLTELAQQGNPEAISKRSASRCASLIRGSLENENLIKYGLKDGQLNLILAAREVPDRDKLVALIRKTMTDLGASSIARVKIYGQLLGEDFPEWMEEFELKETQGSAQLTPINQPPAQSQKNEFIEALRTFQFSSVVPYKEVLNSDLYRSNIVKLLLFFGLFPWAVSSFARNSGLEDIAWILGIYYASVWGIMLYNLIKPAQFSWRETLKCVVFTAFIGIPLLLFIQQVPPFSLLYTAINSSDIIIKLSGFVLGVGVLEELCKALPIYIFMLRPGKLTEPLTPAFYGAMSGLGFAIAEGAHYSLKYALGLQQGGLGFGDYVLFNTVRFISLPLIHAIWAGIVGYFLGLAAINPSRQNPIIFIGVAIAAVLHGVYNTFSTGLIGLVILTFSILLFVTYLRRSKEMVDEMQQAEVNYQKINSSEN